MCAILYSNKNVFLRYGTVWKYQKRKIKNTPISKSAGRFGSSIFLACRVVCAPQSMVEERIHWVFVVCWHWIECLWRIRLGRISVGGVWRGGVACLREGSVIS